MLFINLVKKILLMYINKMSQPNYIYYDLIQTNLENSDTEPPQCKFNERRNQEFVTHPEDYKFSITRFMIDTPSLPLFRPTI